MGKNLPGALVIAPLGAGEVPDWAMNHYEYAEAVQIDARYTQQQRFSLAGVQMKFSSVRTQDGRFNINQTQGEDSWIIKTPSTVHKHVPQNEYSAMMLAQNIGVTIPEIKLVPLAELDNLPDIQLPDESFAYAIKRFDRQQELRIHTEDFAQIFELYPQQKDLKKNYEQIADVLYRYSDDGLADVQQMARRMLANILLANGDAHLKNWTVRYPQSRTPRLSPAYDILLTLPYMRQETDIALNMAKIKNWYEIDLSHFKLWAERAGLPWQAIHPHLLQAIAMARSHWPEMLKELPMAEPHKKRLVAHWGQLKPDFCL
jgi:serine/threonine-protein kinase HipA